jgi:hypothetical protein
MSLTPLIANTIDAPQQATAQAACNPAIQSCVPPTKECDIRACMSATDREKYEKENNCFFQPSGCQGMDSANQCCSKDEVTGKSKPVDKQIKSLDSKYDWSAYKKQCPQMKQSESPPDELWAQCVKGQKHSSADDWVVTEVLRSSTSANARTYCIDGCSTPPGIVTALVRAGVFIFSDKDNPTGAGPGGFGAGSSFYNACKAHDICYQTCSNTSQASCDAKLLADSLAACNTIPADHETTFKNNFGFNDVENTREKCESAANKMNTGLSPKFGDVGGGGASAFKQRRQQMCQCC